MTMNCISLLPIVQKFSLIRHCDVIKNGSLRMETPFKYPNGSSIDLFLHEESQSPTKGWLLSDLGQTTAYLLDLHVKPWATKKRKQTLLDICTSLEVQHSNGSLQIRVPEKDLSNLPNLMVLLAQACIRISDLAMTQRFRTASVFKEDMEEFFAGIDLPYETGVPLLGQYNTPVEIDFRVKGKITTSLVRTLSTGNSNAAHGLSNEIFRCWYDLSNYRAQNQLITIYDTNNDVFREDDLKRLASLSSVVGFPAEQDLLRTSLGA
jgi:hypothetical protein